jgi:predicted secreted protein
MLLLDSEEAMNQVKVKAKAKEEVRKTEMTVKMKVLTWCKPLL